MTFYDIIGKNDDINFKNIKFSKHKNKTGKRMIKVFYDKKTLGFKFPKLRLPFDCKVNNYNKLELNLSLDDQQLINKLSELDDLMLKFAKEYNWFEDNIEPQYYPIVKKSNDGYNPLIKFYINKNNDDTIKPSFYDTNKEKLNIKNVNDVESLLKKSTIIRLAVELPCVWFYDNRFGVCWNIEQIKIVSHAQNDYTFASDDEFSDIGTDLNDIDAFIED